MQGMNRQYRRELKRQEKLRQQRVERAAARRERARQRWRARRQRVRPERPPFRFREWLARPYKSEDLFLLFAVVWLARWAAFRAFGLGLDVPVSEAPVSAVTWAVLTTQVVTGAVALAYIRWLAREPVQWAAPPERPLGAASFWGGAAAAGVLAYGLGRGGEWLIQAIFNTPPGRAPMQVAAPVDWTQLAALGGPALTALFALTFLLVTPLADELFYRRLLTRVFLRSGMADRWAVLFTAFLYGLGIVGIIPPPRAAVAGVVFGYTYVRSGATGPVVVAHILTAVLTALLG